MLRLKPHPSVDRSRSGGRTVTARFGSLHRLPLVLLIGTAAVFLSTILCVSPGGPALAASLPGTLKIGVLAPLSGPYAAGGTSFVQAATLAVEQANAEGGVSGRRVEIAVGDSQGRGDVAKAEALRLVSREKVSALVGAYLSERKVRRYGFVGAGIRWNHELAGTLERMAAAHGITPAYSAFYSAGNPAFDHIEVAAAAASPDIVILRDPGRNSVSFLKRLREVAPALPVLSVGGALGDARLAASIPLSAPVYVQAAAWRGGSPDATADPEPYQQRYRAPPVGYSDTLPYDAVTVLVAAWRTAGSVDSAVVVPVLEFDAFPGVAGTYRFDAAHQARWGAGPGTLHGTFVRWERDGARIVFPPR